MKATTHAETAGAPTPTRRRAGPTRVTEAGPIVEPCHEPGEEWDRLVERWNGSTYCHLAAWHDIMADTLGVRPLYMTARDAGGTMVGVLPLMEVRSVLTGHYLMSMPFLNYGGPLGSPPACRALVREAERIASHLGVDEMQIRARKPLDGGCAPGPEKVAVLLDLPPDEETLWHERFKSKLRSQIKRPIREGMEARFGREHLPAFYEIFAENMRDLGTPVLPRRYFERVAERLGHRAVFCVVYLGDRPVAGGYGIRHENEFEIVRASALRAFSREAPNMLLYWSLMRDCIANGITAFSFGRCTPGSGTHRFKRQWGGRDVPLPWARWPAGPARSAPSAASPKYRLASAAWKRLPLFVANRVGPVLARRLP